MAPNYLNLLFNFILNEYFREDRCVFLLTEYKFGMISIETNVPVVILQTKSAISNYELLFSHDYGCRGIILHVKEPHLIFAELEQQIRLHSVRFNERRYLILPLQKGAVNTMKIFEEQLDYVADLLVVILEESSRGLPSNILDLEIEETYSFYTHQYFGYENCSRPVLVEKWNTRNSSLMNLKNLYPNKLNAQMGRKLRVATFTYLPYSIPSNKVTSIKTFLDDRCCVVFRKSTRNCGWYRNEGGNRICKEI